MNLFYENLPDAVFVHGEKKRIITDFVEYIRLFDMLKDTEVTLQEKALFISEYFLDNVYLDLEAIRALEGFVLLKDIEEVGIQSEQEIESTREKPLFSFTYDFPCIYAAFLREYGIDLKIAHMHWWRFRMLFDNLSEESEIKQRIKYRAIDVGSVKDKGERDRIRRIQRSIMLPEAMLSDFEIGDAFA